MTGEIMHLGLFVNVSISYFRSISEDGINFQEIGVSSDVHLYFDIHLHLYFDSKTKIM